MKLMSRASGSRRAFRVDRALGFLESVYEEALAVELGLRSLPFRRQVPVPVEYKGHRIGDAKSRPGRSRQTDRRDEGRHRAQQTMYLDRRAADSMCTQVDLVTRFDLGVLAALAVHGSGSRPALRTG